MAQLIVLFSIIFSYSKPNTNSLVALNLPPIVYIQGQTGAKARAEGHRGAMQQTLRHQKEKRLAAFAYLIVKKITKIKQKEKNKKQVEFLKKFGKGRKRSGEIKFSRGNEPKWVFTVKRKARTLLLFVAGRRRSRREGEGMDQLAALLLLVNS